jgi:hypothetical protein
MAHPADGSRTILGLSAPARLSERNRCGSLQNGAHGRALPFSIPAGQCRAKSRLCRPSPSGIPRCPSDPPPRCCLAEAVQRPRRRPTLLPNASRSPGTTTTGRPPPRCTSAAPPRWSCWTRTAGSSPPTPPSAAAPASGSVTCWATAGTRCCRPGTARARRRPWAELVQTGQWQGEVWCRRSNGKLPQRRLRLPGPHAGPMLGVVWDTEELRRGVRSGGTWPPRRADRP